MYKQGKLQGIQPYEAKKIEKVIARKQADGESLDEGTLALEYVEQAIGVPAHMDYRTDRFDQALEAIEKQQKSNNARKATLKVVGKEGQEPQPNEAGKSHEASQ